MASIFLYTCHQNGVIKFYISKLFAILDLLRYLDWYVMFNVLWNNYCKKRCSVKLLGGNLGKIFEKCL